MAENYLITGYWGEPHVTAENDRGINAAMFGVGRFVLPVGEQFRAEYIGNNTIRMYDGKLMDNGAAAGIPAGKYIDLPISNAGQGMNRNDLIVFQYEQDGSTLIESGTFIVMQGAETSGTATDPSVTQQDLLSNAATFDQMVLWRVPVSSTTISAPVRLFTVYSAKANVTDATGVLPIVNGGHGATTAADARSNLGITPENIGALPLTGGTMTGNVVFDGDSLGVTAQNDTYKMHFRIGSGGDNRGIYDNTKGDWIVYADANNDVWLNGTADFAAAIKSDTLRIVTKSVTAPEVAKNGYSSTQTATASTVSGYTPLAVVGFGSSSSYVMMYGAYLNGTNITYFFRNMNTTDAITPTIEFRILYVKTS